MNIQSLEELLSPDQFTIKPDDLNNYGQDWTKHYEPKPSAVVFPRSTEDVQKIILWARENKVGLVPSGGRTGLSAAAYATNGEIVVSFEKMNKILGFNRSDQTVTCQAGVITEQLQNFAKDKGHLYPIDFAARGSSQIGGNIATNAGGIKVIRYGLTRSWVASLTVVTGAGEVLNLNNSLVKNASGYDFRHLFIGSEGSLGFVTEAVMKVTRPPKELSVFLFSVPELSSVMNVFAAYQDKFNLMAYEMFTDLALKHVEAQGHIKCPFETKEKYYVLIEIEKETEQSLDEAMQIFEQCMEKGWISDGTVSQNSQQAQDIWRLREDISEATALFEPYKNDISVTIANVPDFLNDMDDILVKDYPDFEVVWFGHIGDGNLHINILKPKNLSSEEFMSRCKEVDKSLFAMIGKYNGSVSAEHGVGLTKKAYLGITRSSQEIDLMKQIKNCFDPDGIMNPGKIF